MSLETFLSDPLGSTALLVPVGETTDALGAKLAEMRYKSFGETRYSSGALGTYYKFTGQREQTELGLYFYQSRWYDPVLGRFASADNLLPGGAQGLDRYAYVSNNPVRYTDPTGHYRVEEPGSKRGCSDPRYCWGGVPKSRQELMGMRYTCQPWQNEVSSNRISPYHPEISSYSVTETHYTGPSAWVATVNFFLYEFDLLENMGIAEKLLKRGFLLGKAINPDPGLDFILGASGQAISDLEDANLSVEQRVGRSISLGIESAITGVASDIGGLVGFGAGEMISEFGGGIPGYAIGALGTSVYFDAIVWPAYNQNHFSSWGLGNYP